MPRPDPITGETIVSEKEFWDSVDASNDVSDTRTYSYDNEFSKDPHSWTTYNYRRYNRDYEIRHHGEMLSKRPKKILEYFREQINRDYENFPQDYQSEHYPLVAIKTISLTYHNNVDEMLRAQIDVICRDKKIRRMNCYFRKTEEDVEYEYEVLEEVIA